MLEIVDDLDREGKIRRFTYTDKRGHRHSFRYVNLYVNRYVNDVPLNKSHPDFMANYVDYLENQETDPDGKIKYCNRKFFLKFSWLVLGYYY